jgi:hypothetical protein
MPQPTPTHSSTQHHKLVDHPGASGYTQINLTEPKPQHICMRAKGDDGQTYNCTNESHKKKKIANGGAAVLCERLEFEVTVARYEANSDLTVVSDMGVINLVGHPDSTIRAGHAAFALGSRLRHSWGASNGLSVASFSDSQPHGAISVTFMIAVASYTDAVAQLTIWQDGLQAPTLTFRTLTYCTLTYRTLSRRTCPALNMRAPRQSSTL